MFGSDLGDALSCRVANFSSASTACGCDICGSGVRMRLGGIASYSIQSGDGDAGAHGVIQVVSMVASCAV